MIQIHLHNQFARVYSHFSGKDVEITLQQMADILCCTKRNARIVLNKMIEQGWLNWLPVVGRSNQSTLQFCCSLSDIQQQRIAHWFQVGKLATALEELNYDKQRLFNLINEYLGSYNIKGKSELRLAYWRTQICIEPIKPTDELESFFVKLIFNGLTKLNEKTGKVQADLAHRWLMITPRHWRFFLHSNVQFHDNNEMTVKDVMSSLTSISSFPYFSHIQGLFSPAPNVLDIYLSKSDYYLYMALAQPQAKIYRIKRMMKNEQTILIGTGAYYIEENSYKKLHIKRNKTFFGYHPEMNEISVWLLNDKSVGFDISDIHPDLNTKLKKQLKILKGEETVKLENGSIFLWLNRISGIAKNDVWAAYLNQLFLSVNSMVHFEELRKIQSIFPAQGLIPKWHHMSEYSLKSKPLSKKNLKLAYPNNNPVFFKIALVLQQILRNEGIELEIKEETFEEIANFKQYENTDIWLSHLVFNNNASDEILTWLYNHQYLYRIMPAEEVLHIRASLEQWRKQKMLSHNSNGLIKNLIVKHQIIPLFHQWIKDSDFIPFASTRTFEEALSELWCFPSINDE